MKHVRFIRSLLLALACSSLFFTGCASHYAVILTDGQHYTAKKKPVLKRMDGQFAFVFTDLSGRTNSIPSGLVRAVIPASDIKPAQ